MITRTRAIVLNQFRYGDTSLVVNMYTEALGRQTIFVKGAYSKKSPTRAVLFQPLHLMEAEIHHRNNRQMQRVSAVQICQIFRNIPFDPVKSCIALFITEVLYKTLKEEEPNQELFDFMFHAIQYLDLGENGIANFHLLFLLHYTRYLGFYPTTEQLAGNHSFNLLTQLLNTGFEALHTIQINRHQRNNLTEFLLSYYSAHVDSFGILKSFPVLQNVFQDS